MSSEDSRTLPLAGKVIPVLRDVIAPSIPPAADLPQLSPEQRVALAAEARVILEEVIEDLLPVFEAELRERLHRRITAMLGG